MKSLGVTNKRSEMIITEYSKTFFKKGDRQEWAIWYKYDINLISVPEFKQPVKKLNF